MTLRQLLENVEFQGEYNVVYYDDKRNARIVICDEKEVYDKTILFIYPESNIVFIEIEYEVEN